MENSLEILDISFGYKNSQKKIFSNISYSFISGDIIGVYGNNGSGKTTLLNCISGYYIPTDGRVVINGRDPDKCRSDIAIIPAEIDLIEYLTLEDNIKFFLEFHKKGFDNSKYDLLLKRYEIAGNKKKYVFEASKGMLRKTQIIISLLMEPKIFLADEPTDGLDENSQGLFFEDVKNFSSMLGSIIIFSLHDEQLLRLYCNKIIRL